MSTKNSKSAPRAGKAPPRPSELSPEPADLSPESVVPDVPDVPAPPAPAGVPAGSEREPIPEPVRVHGRLHAEFRRTACVRCSSENCRVYGGPRVYGSVVIRYHVCNVCGRQFPSRQSRAEYDVEKAARTTALDDVESADPEAAGGISER